MIAFGNEDAPDARFVKMQILQYQFEEVMVFKRVIE